MATPLIPLQRPRRSTTSSQKDSPSLSLTQTTTTNTTATTTTTSTTSASPSKERQKLKQIPIWLSIFFGRPDAAKPQLDHARFHARVSEEIWVPRNRPFPSRVERLLFDTKEANRLSAQQSVHLRNPEARLPILFEAGNQAVRYTEEVLSIYNGPCAICRKGKPRYIMCRPLGATRNGYLDLSDFDKMHRLMSTVASHTGHISRKEEVNWCIGNFLSDRPYMCCLAIPICSIEDQCYRSALLCSQTYITGILDGIIKPHRLKDDLKSPMYSVASPWMGRSFGSSGGKTGAGSGGFPGTPVSSFGAWCEQSRRKRKLYSIGTTVFVGRPDLKIPNRPHRGQLSCLVLSSTWPESTLPGQSKNEADEAYDYCRVAGYHERHILETADYR